MSDKQLPRLLRGSQGPVHQVRSKPTTEPEPGSGPLSPEYLRALQRQAGNTAVTALAIQRSPSGRYQRVPTPKPKFTEAEYAKWRKKNPRHEARAGGSYEADYYFNRYTTKWFVDQGYFFAVELGPFGNIHIDVWIDDRGKGREFRVIRWIDSPGQHSGGPTDPNSPESKPDDGDKKSNGGKNGADADIPDFVDPKGDHQKLFGRIIATKTNADVSFGEGNVVLYEHGAVELFLNDGGSYVFIPITGGRYVVYGPDGKRHKIPYVLPESDIPDPYDDEVEE